MMIYVQVQTTNGTNVSEYVMESKEDLYRLTMMFEQTSWVKAYCIYYGGERIKSFHAAFGFHESIKADKCTHLDFQW